MEFVEDFKTTKLLFFYFILSFLFIFAISIFLSCSSSAWLCEISH